MHKAARKSTWFGGVVSASLLAGCASSGRPGTQTTGPVLTPQPTATQTSTAELISPVIASVAGIDIRSTELQQPLLQAYGLNMLMSLVERDMARDACRQQNIVVTPQDIQKEYDWTLQRMFETASDDREKLLDQFLAQPKAPGKMQTRVEFAIVVDTNAHLRRLAEPAVKNVITEDVLKQHFDETYGATVSVRHIVLANPQEAMAIRARLDAGEDFATLARRYSRNVNSGRLGGQLAPFTINSSSLPENFKRVAFALKEGEVSDPVEADGAYHLIKLEKRNAPKAVKYEDVKESLRQDLEDKVMLEAVNQVRGKLAQQALEQLQINDPILKAEFQKRIDLRSQMIRDRDKIRDEMNKERDKPVARPATAPATTTTPATTPVPATAPVVMPLPATIPVTKPASAPTPASKISVPAPVPPAPAAAATKPVATAPTPVVTTRPAPTTRP